MTDFFTNVRDNGDEREDADDGDNGDDGDDRNGDDRYGDRETEIETERVEREEKEEATMEIEKKTDRERDKLETEEMEMEETEKETEERRRKMKRDYGSLKKKSVLTTMKSPLSLYSIHWPDFRIRRWQLTVRADGSCKRENLPTGGRTSAGDSNRAAGDLSCLQMANKFIVERSQIKQIKVDCGGFEMAIQDIATYFSEEEWAKLTKWQKSAYVYMKRNYLRMTGLGVTVNQPVFMRPKQQAKDSLVKCTPVHGRDIEDQETFDMKPIKRLKLKPVTVDLYDIKERLTFGGVTFSTVTVLPELKEKTNKKFEGNKESQEQAIKQMKEIVQDLKIKIKTIKKVQTEGSLEMENLTKLTGTTDTSTTNRMQEMEQGISDVEDTIERIDSSVKENTKAKKVITQNIHEIWDTIKRPNLRMIGIEVGEEYHLKGTENIFNKIIEENFPNLKKELPMKIQEAYRTPNRLDPKKSPCHIIIKPLNIQNKEKILRAARGKGQVT
ncbi:hypothetical protein STEG23_004211 [Scotinomys teguina]